MPRELKCVKCTKVDRSPRYVVFVLVATFEGENGRIENCYVGKTLADLTDFRKSVIHLSSGQDNTSKSSHLLPEVKDRRPPLFTGKRDEKNKSAVDDFCQHVVKLPNHLLRDEMVVGFFHESSAPDEDGAIELFKAKDSSAAKKPTKVGGTDAAKPQPRETFKDGKETGKADSAAPASSPSSSPTASSSSSVAAAASKSSRLTNVEAAYAEIKDTPGAAGDVVRRPAMASEYSEVKLNEEMPNSRTVFTDDNAYAECVQPGTNSLQNHLEVVTLREKPGRPVAEEALYASVFKAKTPTPDSHQSPAAAAGDEFYEDTSVFAPPPPLKREEEDDEPVLYEDASCTAASFHHLQHQHNQQPPPPPRPRGPSNTSDSDSKLLTSSPAKQSSSTSSAPSSSFIPLTPIPPMPQFPSPTLLNPETPLNGASGVASESGGEIQVVAIGDYESSSDNVLSFRRGTLATLLLQSDSNWWCIRLGTAAAHGWVPAAYWRMLNSGDCASLITRGNSPWFVGKLSRAECEALLMEHGKQQHFVVRESDSGHYALSIKYDDRIHHFPIEVTADKKYNIGKHDFKTVNNVILYYQKNALFHDEHGRGVTLGSPLVIIKH